MPQNSQHHDLSNFEGARAPYSQFFRLLVRDLGPEIARYLTLQELVKAIPTEKAFVQLFNTSVEQKTLNKALMCVVRGDIQTLMSIIKCKPAVFFLKGQVFAPRGQVYYNVSPFQLINFLCDDDMKLQIMQLIPKSMQSIRQAQYAEIEGGGADLVKLDRDPLQLAKQNFNQLKEYNTQVEAWEGSVSVTFPLLENTDGILYYKDSSNNVRFYYANQDTLAIELIKPMIHSEEERMLFDEFKATFEHMENNSSRRSSDAEHQLITQTMQHHLKRQGIRFSWNGQQYQDCRTPFHLLNTYRTYIRLYNQALQDRRWDKVNKYWCEVVGKAQGEEIWLLQRLCETFCTFFPVPTNFQPLKRGFTFVSMLNGYHLQSVFLNDKLNDGLGSRFALYKDGPVYGVAGGCADVTPSPSERMLGINDMLVVSKLIALSKKEIVRTEKSLEIEESSSFCILS